MNWYLIALKKYAVFGGRARRKEFCYFYLFSMVISTILGFLDILVGNWDGQSGGPVLMGLYFLGTIIPTIGVSVRRLHDTGRNGWWLLLYLIPFIGGMVLFWWHTQEGTPRTNNYGSDPIHESERTASGV